jgi:hypothetical protein
MWQRVELVQKKSRFQIGVRLQVTSSIFQPEVTKTTRKLYHLTLKKVLSKISFRLVKSSGFRTLRKQVPVWGFPHKQRNLLFSLY